MVRIGNLVGNILYGQKNISKRVLLLAPLLPILLVSPYYLGKAGTKPNKKKSKKVALSIITVSWRTFRPASSLFHYCIYLCQFGLQRSVLITTSHIHFMILRVISSSSRFLPLAPYSIAALSCTLARSGGSPRYSLKSLHTPQLGHQYR